MTTPLRLLSILLIASACAAPLPEREPIAVNPLTLQDNEWRVTSNVIVITDASGTMYQNATLPEAKALTESFVASMPRVGVQSKSPTYEAGSIGFGGDDRIIAPLGPFDRTVLAAAAADLRPLGAPHPAGGKTPLDAAIAEAGEALAGRPDQSALVIFSDGMPDDPNASIAAAQDAIAAAPGGLCIHTVHTGDDPAGRQFLARLSALTMCGSTRHAATLNSAGQVQAFARNVFAAPAPLPPVGAGDPCTGPIRLQGVNFAFDKADIKPEGRQILTVAAQRLGKCKNVRINIVGHTDSVGSEEYNLGLSLRRADAVRAFFVDAGIAPNRLATEGVGMAQPRASNDTAAGRAENRRVVLSPK